MGKMTRGTGKTKTGALTKQQEKFCRHYALHGNGAEAYQHAYPASRKHTPEYRSNKARKLLREARIEVRVAELAIRAKEMINKSFDISAERVLQEIAAIAMANSDDYYEWGVQQVPRFNKKTGQPIYDNEGNPVMEARPYAFVKPSANLTRTQKAAIVGAEMTMSRTGEPLVAVKMADKLGALKLLGTFNKLFDQRIDHTVSGKNGGPVALDVKDVSEVKTMNPIEAMKAFEAFRQSLGS